MPATFVTVRGGLLVPELPPPFQSGTPAFVTLATLADGNDKAAYIFRVPKTGNTKAVGFRIGTLTTPQDLRISFQDVDAATGNPDGTEDQTVVIASAALAVGWNTTGTITRAVTRGDLLAIVIMADSGVPSLTISVPQLAATSDSVEFPYAGGYTTGWLKYARCGCLALQYDDDSYEPLDGFAYPFTAFNTDAYNTGSAADEIGLIFQLPFTAKVDGGWMWSNVSGDAQVLLYDSDGTSVLATATLDKDQDATAGRHYFTWSSAITLSPSTSYRLVLKPTSGTNVSLYNYEVSSAAHFDMCSLGQVAHYTSRADAGAWTEVTTKRPFMGVRVSSVQTDPGTGGAVTSVTTICPVVLAPWKATAY